MGNGLGQSLFLRVTQEDWPTSSDSHSFEAHSCEQFRRMVCFGGWCRTVTSLGNGPDSHSLAQIHSLQVALCLVPEEWSRFSNQGQTFLRADSFSPGCTLFSAGGMAQSGEWSRLRNRDSYSSLLEKNSPDSSSLMFYLLRADALPRSHRCEWKNGPDDSVYIITMFFVHVDIR
jgi:hypothetical protein